MSRHLMTSPNMIVKLYEIVSEYFKVFKTSLDMFVKIVFRVLGALLAFRALLELKVLGALVSGLGLNAFESCFSQIGTIFVGLV